MSARMDGGSLWLVRPIIDGAIDEDRATLVVGSLNDAIIEANWRRALTGLVYAAREVRS